MSFINSALGISTNPLLNDGIRSFSSGESLNASYYLGKLAGSFLLPSQGNSANSVTGGPQINDEQSMAEAIYDSVQEQMAYQTASAREAMQFSAEQARLNREWQERMSNTAYTRAVSDLKKAGINPIYAVGGGSMMSTPSGSSASGVAQSGASADYGAVAQYRGATGSILGGVGSILSGAGAVMKGSAEIASVPSKYIPSIIRRG